MNKNTNVMDYMDDNILITKTTHESIELEYAAASKIVIKKHNLQEVVEYIDDVIILGNKDFSISCTKSNVETMIDLMNDCEED